MIESNATSFPSGSTMSKDSPHRLAEDMLVDFEKWLDMSQLQSYDSTDLWASAYGAWAKGLYARNKSIGTVSVAPLLALDIVFPQARRFLAHRRSYPICHAHIGLAYLNLCSARHDDGYLGKAEGLVPGLLAMASPGTSGLGWGMKHDWMTVKGLIPRDTPCHTQTAYAFEFFSRLYDTTGKSEYQDFLARIAHHEAHDFPEWTFGEKIVSSYSTRDDRKVVNANSYRMVMLLEAGHRFRRDDYLCKGMGALHYVLSMQNPDGSWPYGEEEPFVDTYHTCFVLKNRLRAREHAGAKGPSVDHAIERGLRYYFTRLYDHEGFPIPFAVKPRMVPQRYDSYDLAESIGLLAGGGFDAARLLRLLRFARDEFQTPGGWFMFRRYPFLHIQGTPYLRYANSAMFLALTKVLHRPRGTGQWSAG